MPKSEFCPTSCLSHDDEVMCNPDGGLDSCWHNKDEEYASPIPIELKWYGSVWIQAMIVGENGDEYIIDSPKSEGVTYIKKTSPLIR